MLKKILRWLLTLIYKVEIRGLDNLYENAKDVRARAMTELNREGLMH